MTTRQHSGTSSGCIRKSKHDNCYHSKLPNADQHNNFSPPRERVVRIKTHESAELENIHNARGRRRNTDLQQVPSPTETIVENCWLMWWDEGTFQHLDPGAAAPSIR